LITISKESRIERTFAWCKPQYRGATFKRLSCWYNFRLPELLAQVKRTAEIFVRWMQLLAGRRGTALTVPHYHCTTQATIENRAQQWWTSTIVSSVTCERLIAFCDLVGGVPGDLRRGIRRPPARSQQHSDPLHRANTSKAWLSNNVIASTWSTKCPYPSTALLSIAKRHCSPCWC
jgi:hypothetical protein